MNYKQMCKERMTDLALTIHQLEAIAFADDTFIMFGSTPFRLRALIAFQKDTLMLNQMILNCLEKR